MLGDAQRARIGALGDFVGPLAIKAGAAYAADQIIDALLDLLDAQVCFGVALLQALAHFSDFGNQIDKLHISSQIGDQQPVGDDDMEINGIAHIQITAGRYAPAREFYRKLLPFLGLKEVMDGPGGYYCVGGRTGFLVSPPDPAHEGERFVQRRIGLHHVCFRARSREDVDQAHAFIRTLGVPIIRAPQEDGWAPGYYSILFEDPDGVRLEINFVPGRGVFDTEDGKVKPVEPRAPGG